MSCISSIPPHLAQLPTHVHAELPIAKDVGRLDQHRIEVSKLMTVAMLFDVTNGWDIEGGALLTRGAIDEI
jgi:hypothetical protein